MAPTNTQAPVPTACPIQFLDVLPGNTFYSYIRCEACQGIFSGYPDGTFRPSNTLTRGQSAKILSIAANFTDAVPAGRQTFNDVAANSTFWIYVERLAQRGIVNGYSCGDVGEPCPGVYYRPQNDVTREQFAKLDALAAGYADAIPETQQTFRDVLRLSVFYAYIERVAMHSVISGYACGAENEPCPGFYFRPGNNITRGQAAKIVSNTFSPNCQVQRDPR